MVSLARAAQCIGRPIKHNSLDRDGKPIVGVVEKVVGNMILVATDDQGKSLCEPESLEWDNNVFLPIIASLVTGTDYEGAQVEVTHDHDMNEYIFIGSPPGANDDGEAHMLYVGMPMMGRFHPVRPTADPWAAYFFEEVCGWAQP